MQHSSELTEDELVLIQEHADQARQSFAGLKKARPKTTAPMASTPKSGTAPPQTTAIPPGTPDNKLAVEFSKAFSAWMKAVKGCPSSKSSTWLRLPEYANLKKLGTGIVPLLTDRLAKGEVPASRALFDIDKVKLHDKVNTSTLRDFRAVILKIEVVHIVETRKLLAAFAERKDELKPRTHDEALSVVASKEACRKVLADPLFEAVVACGYTAVPEILARLKREHKHDPYGYSHDVWIEMLAQIHAIEVYGDRNKKAEEREFEAWLDEYVDEEEHHEDLHDEESEALDDAED